MTATEIKNTINRIKMTIFGKPIRVIVEFDQKFSVIENGEKIGRQYLQLEYEDICHDTGELKTWRGRKWLLSEYMTDDEIIKTGYAAFEALIKHEIMEGYTVDGIKLFNPHVHYVALLESSQQTISRDYPTPKPSRSDLENMVRGTLPYYDIMEHPLIKKCGYYVGGFSDRWVWSNLTENNINYDDLLFIYKLIKDDEN